MDLAQRNEIVIPPPLSLDSKPAEGGESEKRRGVLRRVLDLLKSVRPGSDITKFHVPVQLNMPKSQLQVYGESVYCCAQDLLSKCAEGQSPSQRFLSVVAWNLSTTRPAPFLQAPFNPVLGETHHVSFGDINVMLEQVSHHPPVSALYCTNEALNLQLEWWQSACPRFYGNSVEVTIQGRRSLRLESHGETYEMNCPKLLIRLFPVPGSEWVGTTKIQCCANALEATVVFKGKSLFGLRGTPGQVTGKIRDTRTNEVLYEVNGAWNKVVMVKDAKTGETSILFDGQQALTNLRAPVVKGSGCEAGELEATESVVVWRKAMEAIVRRDWEAAREAKQWVEEQQRRVAKKRADEKHVWEARHFVKAQHQQDWRWRRSSQPVPCAPLRVPSAAAHST